MDTYIFLDSVGVLDAQYPLTHQDSLLLVTESLWTEKTTVRTASLELLWPFVVMRERNIKMCL